MFPRRHPARARRPGPLLAPRRPVTLHATGLALLAFLLAPLSFGPLVGAGGTPVRVVYDAHDPATWSARQLAAQLTVSCVDMGSLDQVRRQSAAGMGGVTLLGTPPSAARLRAALAAAQRSAARGVEPFVMSDEEGGTVQRLRRVIYPLPSAATMGGWSAAHVRRTARGYGTRLRALGVRMDLAPVADLTVPGSYMTSLHRTFSADPDRVARRAEAWRRGMDDAGVASAVKHWPGHGHAANTHNRAATVPPLSRLKGADLVPFERELALGAPVVMVGHLQSRGLTAPGEPASESRRALHYLRRQAGPATVIMTDSLSMAAASTTQGVTPIGAELRSLRAGADWALVCNNHPLRAIEAVRAAIAGGRLPRAQAVASARRIIALKTRYGLLPH